MAIYKTLTAEYRLQHRWIPDGAEEIKDENGLGVVYAYTRGNSLCALAYKGTARKATWHFQFKTREEVTKKANEFFANLKSWKDKRAEWRAEASRPHTLAIADVIVNSWGYDQTNVDFYQVVKVSEHFVWLRPIAAEQKLDAGCGPMSGHVVAVPGSFTSEEVTQHKASSGQYGNSVCFEFGSGSRWEGRPMYNSWYA